ncbi:TRAP transporter small permease (plasmid) [Aquamicrobium terrae]
MKSIERLFDRLLDVTAVLASVILMVMMLATVAKIAIRATFNIGILGIDQISGIMMVYMTFLGAAWVLRSEGHVMVDLLTASVGPRTQRALNILSSLIGAAVCFAMTYYASKAIGLSLRRGVVVAAELEIPRAVSLFAIPVGCVLLGIEFLRRARRFQTGTAVVAASEEH